MQVIYAGGSPPAGDVGAEKLVGLYRHPAPADRRPWLRSNFVISLDGSITGADGRSGSINTPTDQRVFALHRALADVILVGAGTARAEGYRAVDLAPWQRAIREAEGLRPFPTLVVVSRSLDLDPAIADPEPDHGPVLIICPKPASERALDALRAAGIEVWAEPGPQLDLTQIVRRLARSGCPRILCEGGPGLHRDLLAADLVDELSLTIAPTVVGGHGQRTTSGGPLPPYGFRLWHALYAGSDATLFTTWRRVRDADQA